MYAPSIILPTSALHSASLRKLYITRLWKKLSQRVQNSTKPPRLMASIGKSRSEMGVPKECRAGMQCCTQQKERQLNATAERGRNKPNERACACIGYGGGDMSKQARRPGTALLYKEMVGRVGMVQAAGRRDCLIQEGESSCCCCCCAAAAAAGALAGPAAFCCGGNSEWCTLEVQHCETWVTTWETACCCAGSGCSGWAVFMAY